METGQPIVLNRMSSQSPTRLEGMETYQPTRFRLPTYLVSDPP